MNEQEITKTHFSENWAVEQVARFAARGVDGWTFVPHILLQLPAQHRRSAVNALRIAHTLLLIEMRPSANINPHVSADDLAMCPQDSTGEPLAWARLKVP